MQCNPQAKFPPHHFVTLSEPHSSYIALVTAYFPKSSVLLNLAIPFQASSAGSFATFTTTSAPGSRTSFIVPCTRVASPGKLAGEPVKKMFYSGDKKSACPFSKPYYLACRDKGRVSPLPSS